MDKKVYLCKSGLITEQLENTKKNIYINEKQSNPYGISSLFGFLWR